MFPVSEWLKANRLLVELGLALALAIAFATFVHHERAIGAQNEIVKVQAAVARQAQQDAKDLDAAHHDLAALQGRLDSLLSNPPPAPAGDVHVRVCTGHSSPASPHADAGPGPESHAADGPPEPVGQDGGGQDVTDETRRILNDAGAVITYLQGYVRSCQERGFCEKE